MATYIYVCVCVCVCVCTKFTDIRSSVKQDSNPRSPRLGDESHLRLRYNYILGVERAKF